MTRILVYLLVSIWIFGSNILLMLMLKFSPWRIQYILLRKFPKCKPIFCKIIYYLLVIYLYLPIASIILFAFYYGPYILGISIIKTISIVFYLIIAYSYILHLIYLPSIYWNLGKLYKKFMLLSIIFFGIFEFFTCFYIQDFSEAGYSAFFLGNNFLCYCISNRSFIRDETIDPHEFCLKFMEYLEESKKRKEQKNKERNSIRLSLSNDMSSIPDERPNDIDNSGLFIDIPPLDLENFNIPPIPISNVQDKIYDEFEDQIQENTESFEKLFCPIIDTKTDLNKLLEGIKEKYFPAWLAIVIEIILRFITYLHYTLSFM